MVFSTAPELPPALHHLRHVNQSDERQAKKGFASWKNESRKKVPQLPGQLASGTRPRLQEAVVQGTNLAIPVAVAHQAANLHHTAFPRVHKSQDNQASARVDPLKISVDVAFRMFRAVSCAFSIHNRPYFQLTTRQSLNNAEKLMMFMIIFGEASG